MPGANLKEKKLVEQVTAMICVSIYNEPQSYLSAFLIAKQKLLF